MSEVSLDQKNIDQLQYWPIFKELQDPNKKISFWKKGDYDIKNKEILYEGKLNRLGKVKPCPCEYYFYLLKEGTLCYRVNKKVKKIKMKGYLKLDLTIFTKLVDLKNICNKNFAKDDLIRVFRIRKFENNYVYFWSSEYEQTFLWFRQLQRFTVSQNFDAIYKLGDMVGRGGFAKVFKVTPTIKFNESEPDYAAKIYSKELLVKKNEMHKFYVFQSYKLQSKSFIRTEIQLLQSMNSPYVLKLIEVMQLDDVLIIISDFYEEGTLYDFRKKKGMVPEKQASEILLQLAYGIQDVHQQDHVHRDLKLENIMVKTENPLQVVIIDFGFAEVICRERLKGGQGTAGYIAPEIFKQKPYTERSDVFSLGIIFYALLAGKSPFKAETYDALLKLNKECKIEYDQTVWKQFSWGTVILVQSMLELNPRLRISINKLICSLQSHINHLEKNQQGEEEKLEILVSQQSQIKLYKYESEIIQTNQLYDFFSMKSIQSFYQNTPLSISKAFSQKKSVSSNRLSQFDYQKSSKNLGSNRQLNLTRNKKRSSLNVNNNDQEFQVKQNKKRQSVPLVKLEFQYQQIQQSQKKKDTKKSKFSAAKDKSNNLDQYDVSDNSSSEIQFKEKIITDCSIQDSEQPINTNNLFNLQQSAAQYNRKKWI